MTPKPLVILLMGPPGAGKGSLALPLSRHLNLPHISTGDLFREHIRLKTALGIEASTYISKGQLVPDSLVLDMLFSKVADYRQGYILDGFPRTLAQAKALDERLKNETIIAINCNAPDELILARITGRLVCKGCARPYHKLFDRPAVPLTCDACHSPLYQRDDDKEDIVRKRLEVYRTQTEPLIAHYSEKECLKNIDSSRSKEEAFQDAMEELPLIHANLTH